ncbi:hypothetical protein [Nitratireductor sp. ZSWI3]|uniref:hypothetical protein n=1 Tax=Nitratireductor sp. ZSWI3 TaxID=2966359 RepID=UPI00214F7DCC|nr:hypothetical protein [Nitratireductor sp. ZSWI3]MCR4268526.1 hypothetical protein [Nitratireductor sp. ZSWI3]
MKIVFYVLAALAFLAPLVLWAALTSAMCGHNPSSGCRIGLDDFMDAEFAALAALPWGLALIFVLLALQLGRRAP